MNAIQIYIGIVYENKKRIAFSYQVQSLSGTIVSSEDRVIKQQGLENFTAHIINQTLDVSDKNEPLHLGIYTDYLDIIDYINRLIDNRDYDHVKRIMYQPRGKLFKILKNYTVKFIIIASPKSEVFTLVKRRAMDLIDELTREDR